MWYVIAALIATLAFLLFRGRKGRQRRTLSPLATIGSMIAALGIIAGFLTPLLRIPVIGIGAFLLVRGVNQSRRGPRRDSDAEDLQSEKLWCPRCGMGNSEGSVRCMHCSAILGPHDGGAL